MYKNKKPCEDSCSERKEMLTGYRETTRRKYRTNNRKFWSTIKTVGGKTRQELKRTQSKNNGSHFKTSEVVEVAKTIFMVILN